MKRKIVNPLENPVSKLNLPHVSNSRLRALLPDELQSPIEPLPPRHRDSLFGSPLRSDDLLEKCGCSFFSTAAKA